MAILAVDPSSPFTGGALLGDRIRMADALRDPAIYMRSVGSRGQLGGLSAATSDIISLLDAAGFDVILVETVGAGQSEVEIMRLAHTTVVVSVPGLGDEIQANKAGILEIADIFVVNKSDRDGADRTVSELKTMLDMNHVGEPGLNLWSADYEAVARPVAAMHFAERYGRPAAGNLSWRPPVIRAVAVAGEGVDETIDSLLQHCLFLTESQRWQTRLHQCAEERVTRLVRSLVDRYCIDLSRSTGALDRFINAVAAREMDPQSAAEELLALLPQKRR